MKSLKRVWNRSLPPAVREAGRRILETARSAYVAIMRVSWVGSPTFLIDEAFLQSSQGAKRYLTVNL